jgi:hypothetical protein
VVKYSCKGECWKSSKGRIKQPSRPRLVRVEVIEELCEGLYCGVVMRKVYEVDTVVRRKVA